MVVKTNYDLYGGIIQKGHDTENTLIVKIQIGSSFHFNFLTENFPAAVRAATAAKIIAALSRPSSSKATAWTDDKAKKDGEEKKKKKKDEKVKHWVTLVI